MEQLPVIEVNQITTKNGQLVELGFVDQDRTVWRLSSGSVKSLYDGGMRFFMKWQGKRIEVWLRRFPPHGGEAELCTKADSSSTRLLLTLPQFKLAE